MHNKNRFANNKSVVSIFVSSRIVVITAHRPAFVALRDHDVLLRVSLIHVPSSTHVLLCATRLVHVRCSTLTHLALNF